LELLTLAPPKSRQITRLKDNRYRDVEWIG
jgi:hypothetical protein